MTTTIMEKPPTEGEPKPVNLLQDYCFCEGDDPRWAFMNPILMGEGAHTDNIGKCYDINLTVDSFIFAFTGRRGAGKTTSMTDEAAKSSVIYRTMRLLPNYPSEFDVMYLHLFRLPPGNFTPPKTLQNCSKRGYKPAVV